MAIRPRPFNVTHDVTRLTRRELLKAGGLALGILAPLCLLTVGAWDYYRLAGVASDSTVQNTKENIFNTEMRVGRQLSPKFAIEPLVGFRQWNPAGFRGGRLYTFGANTRFVMSDQFSGVATARIGTGWVFDPAAGSSDVTATGLMLYIRYQR